MATDHEHDQTLLNLIEAVLTRIDELAGSCGCPTSKDTPDER